MEHSRTLQEVLRFVLNNTSFFAKFVTKPMLMLEK